MHKLTLRQISCQKDDDKAFKYLMIYLITNTNTISILKLLCDYYPPFFLQRYFKNETTCVPQKQPPEVFYKKSYS